MTVVFLHGVAGSRATYAWLGSEVAGHAVVRPDFRGHGAAVRTPGAYLISDYVADAVAALRAAGPAFVVGHSLGGVAAWWASQLVPELVLGAVLEDPPLYMGEPAGHASNGGIPAFRALREQVPAWQAEGISEAEAAQRLAAEPFAPDPSRTVGEVSTDEARASRAYALLHLDPTVLDTVIDGTLLAATDVTAPVTVPMLILAADDALGAAFPERHEQRLRETHPAIEVSRIAGAGHSIHDERSNRATYLERVTAFIDREGRAGVTRASDGSAARAAADWQLHGQPTRRRAAPSSSRRPPPPPGTARAGRSATIAAPTARRPSVDASVERLRRHQGGEQRDGEQQRDALDAHTVEQPLRHGEAGELERVTPAGGDQDRRRHGYAWRLPRELAALLAGAVDAASAGRRPARPRRASTCVRPARHHAPVRGERGRGRDRRGFALSRDDSTREPRGGESSTGVALGAPPTARRVETFEAALGPLDEVVEADRAMFGDPGSPGRASRSRDAEALRAVR